MPTLHLLKFTTDLVGNAHPTFTQIYLNLAFGALRVALTQIDF